jgi:hypothetical protein
VPQSNTATTSLIRDERGSILIIAIPLGLLLVGVVWHLVGVCDTVLMAQLLRFSADQTAFETAIWHARGMNIIATINLAMQAISAIWVAWHVLGSSVASAGIVCDTSSVCNGKSTQDAYSLASKMMLAEPKVIDWFEAQLSALSDLERSTSAITPVIALVKATQSGSGAPTGSWLKFTVPFTGSLVPDNNLPGLLGVSASQLSSYPRLTVSKDAPALPLEANEEHIVCETVAELVPDMADKLMPRTDSAWVPAAYKEMKADWKTIALSLAKGMPCLGVNKKPKVAGMWELSKHRSDHAHEYAFQVYGFAFGKNDKLLKDDEFVRVPAAGEPPIDLKDTWTASQAEFYCDCGGQTWSKCADTAMMTPNWTARLRRVRVPDKSQVTHIFSHVVLPPGYTSHLDSASLDMFTNHAGDVWDRVEKLIH